MIRDGWDGDRRLGTDAEDLARFLSRADSGAVDREQLRKSVDMSPEQYADAWRTLHRFGYVTSAELRRLAVD